MRTLSQDLRYGFRFLRKNPGFTIVAVLTLAVGIACTSTVASWTDGLLRGYSGVPQSDRVAVLEMFTASAPNGATQSSWLDYKHYRDNLKSVTGVILAKQFVFTVGEAANAQPVWGELVSGNYFALLGVTPMLGRSFTDEEASEKPGAYPIAVIGYRLWRARFHGDPSIVGKTVRVNGRELTIIGVTKANFLGTAGFMTLDLWVPVTMGPELGLLGENVFRERSYRDFYLYVRLKPGIRMEQARAEAAIVARNLELANPKTNHGISATTLNTWEQHNGANQMLVGPLRILMAVSIAVLLIVCANVANLLLARSVSRRKEFGIRLALGAGRLRLARQLLTETFLLAVAGAVIGFPLCLWMGESLAALVPNIGLPIISHFENGRIAALTILTCICAALISGAAPALFSLRSGLNESLKVGGRSGSSGSAANRTRRVFVVVEVALAAVALIGASLFLRSFQNARTIYPGFERANVLYGRFFIESASFSETDALRFCTTLKQRLESRTGIQAVSYSDFTPLSGPAGPWVDVAVEGYTPARGETMGVNRSYISPGYFNSLHIPLLDGRDFRENDDRNAPPVMIVNETFAHRFFRAGNPIGHRVRWGGKWVTVAGVAKDSKYFSPAEPPLPFFYAPFRQFYRSSPEMAFYVKTDGDPKRAIATLRGEVAATDPRASAFHAVPFAEYTEIAVLTYRIAAMLLSGLGAISLLLAAVGLYSVMSFAVSQRTREIGIRMAMGARPGNVIGMIIGQGMTLTIVGLAAGIAVAFGVTRLVSSMLVNITAADPISYAAAAVFLGLFALLACYVPARRATRIDPIAALRAE
jgi:predicted permease